MKAEEARKLSDAVNANAIQQLLDSIFESIKHTCNIGEYNIRAYILNKYETEVIGTLEQNGFVVRRLSNDEHSDEDEFGIYWSNSK